MKKMKKLNYVHKMFFILFALFGSIKVHAQIWNPLNTQITNDLKACYFIDANTGWVSGDSGTVIKTTDGGTTWSMHENTGTTNSLRSIYFLNANTGWAAGDNGTAIKTTDGGSTWNTLVSGVTVQINAIKFADANNGWFTGQNANIRHTTNGGTSWSPQLSGIGGSNIWGLSVSDPLNAFCVGSGHKGSKTVDGNSWTAVDFGGGALVQYNDVAFPTMMNGLTINSAGGISRTTTGGSIPAAWVAQVSPTTNELLGIDMLDITKGWICGRTGIILSTTDSGSTWGAEASGTLTHLWQIDFVNDTTGWAVGGNGLVIKYQKVYPTSPLTLLQPNGSEIYQIGTTQNIIWLVNGVTCITLQYSIDNGANWINIPGATNLTTPPNSFPWPVPNNSSLQALVRIFDCTNPTTGDTSDATFYIQPVPRGKEYAVLLTATSSNAPPQITIDWVPDPSALTYNVDRKLKSVVNWTSLTSVPVNANTYTDFNVNVGEAWEYRVTKTTPQLTGYGYIYAGLELPETDFRGTIMLLIDNNFASSLTTEINQLELDLIGDGYKVVKTIVNPSIGVPAIKNIITQEYINGGNALTTIITIGHLPTAYSGNFAPDGHSERIGSQPCDGYYGDMDGIWTDTSVTVINMGPIFSTNTIGDGRFDQSNFPSAIELQVGRIDLHNEIGFGQTELNLIKQYLNRDHDFKLKVTNPSYRGLINSTMDLVLPTTSAGAWRSFYAMFGSSIKEMNLNYAGVTEFMDSLTNRDYLWTHMAGGGSDTSMTTDVFTSTGCINNPINTVFMQMYGSYFVEWYKGSSDTVNTLLRAPLASNGTTLATVWSGKAPYWHFHHMGLGETIGYSTVTNQNNLTTYTAGTNSLLGGIHMALMGDPTLKMHIVAPVSNVTSVANSSTIDISWTASPDNNIVGYNIYRANNTMGTFVKINTAYVTANNYTDATPLAGSSVYMVRAVQLRSGTTGSYYNMSTGLMDSTFINLSVTETSSQDFYIYPNPTSDILNFSKELPDVKIYNAYGQMIESKMINTNSMDVTNLANGIYFIRWGQTIKKFVVKH